MKHILIVAIVQSIIMYTIVFAGEYMIYEPDPDLRRAGSVMVYPGRFSNWDGTPLYNAVESALGPSRHFTIVFNVFVFMQIFGLVNARKINDELNIFADIHLSYMFIGIWVGIFAVQIIIVQLTGVVFQCCPEGLAW